MLGGVGGIPRPHHFDMGPQTYDYLPTIRGVGSHSTWADFGDTFRLCAYACIGRMSTSSTAKRPRRNKTGAKSGTKIQDRNARPLLLNRRYDRRRRFRTNKHRLMSLAANRS